MAKEPAARRHEEEPENTGDAARSWERLHIWEFQGVRDLLVVAATIGIFSAGYALRAVTIPLLVALLLAYLFEPLIVRMTRHPKISRPMAVGGILGALGVGLLVVLIVLVPVVVSQTANFASDVTSGDLRKQLEKLEVYVPSPLDEHYLVLVDRLPDGPDPIAPDAEPAAESDDGDSSASEAEPPSPGQDRLAQLEEQIAQLEERIATGAAPPEKDTNWLGIAKGTLTTVTSVIGAIISFGLLSFLIPFYFFFFSVWWPDVVAFGRQLIPERHRDHSLDLLSKMDEVVAGFVRGRIVISLIMGLMLGIGWWICGVPYALPVGLITGVFCAVPYLGGVGVPIALILALVSWLDQPASERWALWIVIVMPIVVFSIVQIVEGYVLTPMIAGKATNLDPVTILVAVLAGGSVLGIYGMLLAIPAIACGKILFLEVLMPRVRAWVRGETRDPLPIDGLDD